MKPILKFDEEKRERKSMYASDYGKLAADVILSLQKVEATNPIKWTDTLRMSAGKGVELQMVKILKQNEVVDAIFDQESAPSTEIERMGVPIRMKFDALGKESHVKCESLSMPEAGMIKVGEGEPIEIKSINNKNSFDIQKYIDGNPRESYVGQLAIYMDALGKEKGHLFVSSIDGLHTFWFVCEKKGEGIYQCGNTIVDLNKEYARFKEIWNNKDNEPKWGEVRYKKPIEEVEWDKLSVSKIGDARNGRAVIGDEDSWKILYSPYKELIVAKQGVGLGYSEEELELIKVKTTGFSSKKK